MNEFGSNEREHDDTCHCILSGTSSYWLVRTQTDVSTANVLDGYETGEICYVRTDCRSHQGGYWIGAFVSGPDG